MTRLLQLADGLGLDPSGLELDPDEATTQTYGIIGAKGSGKSYFAMKFAEELYDSACPFVVLDPIGNWGPALRRSADGKGPGLGIPIIGGDYGDVPLDVSKAAELGRFIREKNASAIVDLSELSKNKRKDFVAEFAEALYRASRKAQSPYLVMLEEAQVFAPQQFKGQERMLGAITDIVRLGRNYGLGSLLITQRPASVNKEVLNQVEMLLVGNLRGAHERKAIGEWVTTQGIDAVETLSGALKELPSLKPGEFWAWSPSWLEIFRKVKVSKRRTFDASSTPRFARAAMRGQKLATVSLETELGALRALMASDVDADETPEVKSEAKPAGTREIDTREVATLRVDLAESNRLAFGRAREIDRLRARVRELESAVAAAAASFQALVTTSGEHPTGDTLANWSASSSESRPSIEAADAESWVAASPAAPATKRKPTAAAPGAVSSYGLELLGALAQFGAMNRKKLSLITGKSRTSSTFAQAIRDLCAAGFVDDGDLIRATPLGQRESSAPPLPTGKALYVFWHGRLGRYDQVTLATLWSAAKTGLTRKELSQLAGHSLTSSTFAGSVRRLITLGLFAESGGRIVIDEDFRRVAGTR